MNQSRMPGAVDRRQFVKQVGMTAFAAGLGGCISSDRALSRDSLAGKLVMIDFHGTELDQETAAFIRDHGIQAVVLFQRNLVDSAQTRRLTAQLREALGPQALIAIDQEGGAVVRTRDLPFPPSAMSLGATGDEQLAYEVGRAVGRALNGLGINWTFAPSLDVNNNRMNPVISDRSFGSNPAEVARLGLAWARGCQEAGVATCVKHFPGHGDTQVDSHVGLPVVNKPREELDRLELFPFRAAVAAGIPAVMTSHILYPVFDTEHPATLSPAILSRLLRTEWGYDGVVITDAMDMRAIAERYGRGEAALLALRAGADLVLAQGSRKEQMETLRAIDRALRNENLEPERVQRSLARTETLGTRFPAAVDPYSDVQLQQDAALMRRAWAAGLTAYNGPQAPAPGSRVLLVIASDAAGGGASERGLRGMQLAERLQDLYDLQTVAYDPARPHAALDNVASLRRPGDTVVFVSTARHRPEEELRSFVAEVGPDLHIALWNPYAILDVQAPALVSYGFRPEALDAVRAWLAGEITAGGELPIALA